MRMAAPVLEPTEVEESKVRVRLRATIKTSVKTSVRKLMLRLVLVCAT
jgi:hypothetical protein